MKASIKLILIKSFHTLIWVLFNIVITYLFYAAITNKIDKWAWLSSGLIAAEGIVLLLFGKICPLTLIARRYSDSPAPNFDIFLPAWLAKYNQLIYTVISLICGVILIYRLAAK